MRTTLVSRFFVLALLGLSAMSAHAFLRGSSAAAELQYEAQLKESLRTRCASLQKPALYPQTVHRQELSRGSSRGVDTLQFLAWRHDSRTGLYDHMVVRPNARVARWTAGQVQLDNARFGLKLALPKDFSNCHTGKDAQGFELFEADRTLFQESNVFSVTRRTLSDEVTWPTSLTACTLAKGAWRVVVSNASSSDESAISQAPDCTSAQSRDVARILEAALKAFEL